MLLEPGPSPYDLNFRLFGTPVRVAPWFWLVSAIFGWKFAERLGLAYLGLWIACAFFSILLHEFGHVWAGRAFGSDGSIVLYSFGGLAIGSNDVRQRWERIVVSLAGPGIQLALYGALKLAEYRMGEKGFDDLPPALQITLGMLMWINLFWPLFNLMPVWPLDGGMVTREICTGLSRQNGLQISLRISFAAALLLAIHAIAAEYGTFSIRYLPTGLYPALFFGLLAYESYLLFKQSSVWHYEPPDDRLPWE